MLSGTLYTLAAASRLAGALPAVLATLLLILVVTVLIRGTRWCFLRWRARTPRVQIATFAWTASPEEDHEATWITSLFREQLSNLRLDPLDPLPERAPGAPVVEIVESLGQSVGGKFDLGAVLGRIYRAAFPDAAYEVWGTLRPLRGGGGRISVQLVDRARGSRTLVNAVSDQGSWEESAVHAAMAVAGGLYPRVSKRHKGPWTRWRGQVPHDLVELYHEARQHEAGNCLEQALGAYHRTLERDPLNPNLRLKIAMLQERLGLDLDAWVTYNAIIDESDRDAWKGPDRKARLLALFRLAVLLCNGRIASTWVDAGSVGEEDLRRRDELRMALKADPLLKDGKARNVDYLQAAVRVGFERQLRRGSAMTLFFALPDWGRKTKPAAWVDRRFPDPVSSWAERTRERYAQKIKEVLEIVALRRLEDLDSRLRVRPPWRIWRIPAWQVRRPPLDQWLRRRELSRAAVRLSKRLTRLRIAANAERRIEAWQPNGSLTPAKRERELEKVRQAHLTLTRRWPFPPTRWWAPVLRWIGPRRRWANRREDAWQLHYNAACTAASTLLDDSLLSLSSKLDDDVLPGKTSREDVVKAAIAELEEYAHRVGSRRVAEQADWLALEDPDLAGLFDRNEFKLWASHHLPWKLPKDRPSREVDVNLVAAQMLHQGARTFAKSWQARAQAEMVAPEAISSWWREEQTVWSTFVTICTGHPDWRKRLDCLEVLQKCLAATDAAERIEFTHETRSHDANDGSLEPVLDDFMRLVGQGANGKARPGGVGSWVSRRAEYVRGMDDNSSGRAASLRLALLETERAEARRAARIWDGLAKALESQLEGNGSGKAELSQLAELLPDPHRPVSPSGSA